MKKLFTNKILQCFILLIFVLLLHISLGYKLRPFYVLTFTAFLLCLSGYFKRTYFIFIILLMMVGAIYSPIGLKYGSPNINSIISIFYTNTHESLEFILSVSPISLAFSCLLILFGLLSLKVNLLIGKKLSLFTVSILEDMGTDLFEMMGDFGLQFHPNVAMAFRSLITLQGSLQETDPTFNLSEVMKTFLKSQLTMEKGKEVLEQTIEDELLNTLPRLRAFPRRIDRVLRQAENGDFTIQMGIFSHKENKQFANEVLNLVFLSFAGISFGILSLGALFLAQNEIQEGYSFLNIFGYSGLGLSVIMLIRVAIQSMYRTKK